MAAIEEKYAKADLESKDPAADAGLSKPKKAAVPTAPRAAPAMAELDLAMLDKIINLEDYTSCKPFILPDWNKRQILKAC